MSASKKILFILYTADQTRSQRFYTDLLLTKPSLDVTGMTEIPLSDNTFLGLMPAKNIVSILEGAVITPDSLHDAPRCELYLYVDDPDIFYERAISLGARPLSAGKLRNWGDYAAYCADFDNNIIAFAHLKK